MKKIFLFIFFYLGDGIILGIGFILRLFSQKKGMLIIKPDGIGDYILFRNFLKSIKESKKYCSLEITILLNPSCLEFAQKIDSNWVTDFIPLDIQKFRKNPPYRYKFFFLLLLKDYQEVFHPIFSRDFRGGDSIIRIIRGKQKTGFKNDYVSLYLGLFESRLSDSYYTRIIDTPDNLLFEFEKMKSAVTRFINEPVFLKKPEINKAELDEYPIFQGRNYIVIFPGANQESRKWCPEFFSELVNQISTELCSDIVIAGGKSDQITAKNIIKKCNNVRITDLTGETTILQLGSILAGSSLLISNETGAVHLAAALDVPIVCISNGNHIGRYSPYPAGMSSKAFYVYPDQIIPGQEFSRENIKKYKFGSDLNINSIPVERVFPFVEKILKNQGKV